MLKKPLWIRGRKPSWLRGTDGMTHWDSAMSIPKRKSVRMDLSEMNFHKPGPTARLQRAGSISNMGEVLPCSAFAQGGSKTASFEFSILLRHTNKEVNRRSAILNSWRGLKPRKELLASRESHCQRGQQFHLLHDDIYSLSSTHTYKHACTCTQAKEEKNREIPGRYHLKKTHLSSLIQPSNPEYLYLGGVEGNEEIQ